MATDRQFSNNDLLFCGSFQCDLSLRAVTFFFLMKTAAAVDREIVALSCLLGEIITINFVFGVVVGTVL